MTSILLIRHGPVALKASGLLSFEAFCAHLDAYERAGVDPGAATPATLARLAQGAVRVFASDAPRVGDTLKRLGVVADISDSEFREAPPLAPDIPLRLPALAWLALARARGAFDPGLATARADLRHRAEGCAIRLTDAASDGAVALVGHGWFNRYVGAALTNRGWRKSAGPGFGRTWGYAVYADAAAMAATGSRRD